MRALACLLAIMFALTLTAPPAFAQAEDRGYGGPATVGPNFSTGKQSAPPDFGSGTPKKKPAYKKPSAAKMQAPPKAKSAAKPTKPKPVAKTVKKPSESKPVAETAKADKPAEPEPKADAKPSAETTAAKPETCRRFDATTGTTLEVPCT
jgi:outer membrane biosynthesis protein TonB